MTAVEDGFDLDLLVLNSGDDLNRTHGELLDLADQLVLDPHTETWVAEDGRGVVGFVALHLGRKAADRHTASLRIHLAADARGNGLGSKLMKVALKWADENGITRITATPYVHEARADWFFHKLGFSYEGTARNAARLPDGTLVDVAQLARVR